MINKYITTMAVTRFLFGLINFIGVFFMLRYNTPEQALRVNGIIGSIGPFVFLFVSMVGLAGMAGKISTQKMILLIAGIILIWLGTKN